LEKNYFRIINLFGICTCGDECHVHDHAVAENSIGNLNLSPIATAVTNTDVERANPAIEDVLEAGNLLETQQPVPEMDNHGHLEDSRLIDRARAVGVVYEFAHPGVDETDDDRRKREQ